VDDKNTKDLIRQSMERLDSMFDPAKLKQHLMLYALYILSYEQLKGRIVNMARSQYYEVGGSKMVFNTQKYEEEVLSLDQSKTEIRASISWLRKLDGLTDVDIDLLKTVKKTRDKIAHEMYSFFTLDLFEQVANDLMKLLDLYKRLDVWYVKFFESDHYSEEFRKNADLDEAMSVNLTLLHIMRSMAFDDDEKSQEMYDVFKQVARQRNL